MHEWVELLLLVIFWFWKRADIICSSCQRELTGKVLSTSEVTKIW